MKIAGSPGTSKVFNTSPVVASYRTGDVVVVSATKVISNGDNVKEALLKFPDGNHITTFLNSRFGLKEGDFFLIKIQKAENGTVYATFVSKTPAKSPTNSTEKLLGSLNLPHTEKNLQIAMQLLRFGLGSTVENFDSLIIFQEQYPWISLEQVAFMLKNKISIDDQSVSVMYSMLSGSGLIGEELFLFLQGLQNKKKDDQLKSLLKKFFINPGSPKFNANELFYSQLTMSLIDILSYIINKRSLGENSESYARKFAENEKNKKSVLNDIRDFNYFQLPVNINGSYNTAEIFHKEKKDGKKGAFNVLHLKIPTKNLGLVQLFLSIDASKRIQCGFAAESNIDIIKQKILELSDMLKDIGYHLVKVTYNQLPSDINILNFERYAELIVGRRGYDELI